MSFADHAAALDEAVFSHLADDAAGVWTPRGAAPLQPVRVIFDQVERPAEIGGVNLLQTAHVVRLLASEVEGLAPGRAPGEGDTVSAAGRTVVVRGQPWRDGGDWVCTVS